MKKKSSGDLMQDPFYAKLMLAIETVIHKEDLAAKNVDLEIKDSDAKSAIRKALGTLKGTPPKKLDSTPSEQWVLQTARELVLLHAVLRVEDKPLEAATFCRALLAVEDSLKLRREMAGHSRGYLDFLTRFIEEKKI
ncbi:hypothetical protein [Pontiella sp.]|uniref:hypothetical protein n=1 Tax=Pontiella sp. TaxID=2837462 RepID=UPI003566F1F6